MGLQWFQKKKPKVSGKKIKVIGMSADELLLKGGYKKHIRGYTRPLDNTHRYHAFVLPENKIEIHTDLFKPTEKHTYHVASTHQTAEERKRLKNLLPPTPVKVWYKSKLTREEYLQAMASLNHKLPQ